MQTMEFMEKVKEVHDRLNEIAFAQWINFTVMVAAGKKWDGALTYGTSNMEYEDQVLSLHLFHNYIQEHYEP